MALLLHTMFALIAVVLVLFLALDLQLSFIQYRPLDSVSWRYHWYLKWWRRPLMRFLGPWLLWIAVWYFCARTVLV